MRTRTPDYLQSVAARASLFHQALVSCRNFMSELLNTRLLHPCNCSYPLQSCIQPHDQQADPPDHVTIPLHYSCQGCRFLARRKRRCLTIGGSNSSSGVSSALVRSGERVSSMAGTKHLVSIVLDNRKRRSGYVARGSCASCTISWRLKPFVSISFQIHLTCQTLTALEPPGPGCFIVGRILTIPCYCKRTVSWMGERDGVHMSSTALTPVSKAKVPVTCLPFIMILSSLIAI